MRRNLQVTACLLLFLAAVTVRLSSQLYQQSAASFLSAADPAGDEFRRMQLGEEMLRELPQYETATGMTAGEILTVLSPFSGFRYTTAGGRDPLSLLRWRGILMRRNQSGYARFAEVYSAVWNDVACFPVAEDGIVYENSWMFERTYGGLRGHEGTDLMPPENVAGLYRVVSMTDGVVEQIGWLPKGGWRIGIRSPSGGYFYYAHLDSYSRNFRIGETVSAGEVLGLMGDTGYGEEGTRGKFDVHLHLGIYVRTEHYDELSVNPYWVLRFAQSREQETAAVR